jgi:hypothetical protein
VWDYRPYPKRINCFWGVRPASAPVDTRDAKLERGPRNRVRAIRPTAGNGQGGQTTARGRTNAVVGRTHERHARDTRTHAIAGQARPAPSFRGPRGIADARASASASITTKRALRTRVLPLDLLARATTLHYVHVSAFMALAAALEHLSGPSRGHSSDTGSALEFASGAPVVGQTARCAVGLRGNQHRGQLRGDKGRSDPIPEQGDRPCNAGQDSRRGGSRGARAA